MGTGIKVGRREPLTWNCPQGYGPVGELPEAEDWREIVLDTIDEIQRQMVALYTSLHVQMGSLTPQRRSDHGHGQAWTNARAPRSKMSHPCKDGASLAGLRLRWNDCAKTVACSGTFGARVRRVGSIKDN